MRRVYRTLTEWWPAVIIVVLALLSLVMLRSSYERWQAVLEQAVSGVDNVAESRRHLLRAYLVVQHQEAGDPTFTGASAVAESMAAANSLGDWLNGRGSVSGFSSAPPEDPGVIELGRAYEAALLAFRNRLSERPVDPVERRRAFSVAEQAANTLESAVRLELRRTLEGERSSYRIRLAGWGMLLLVTGMGLVVARNAQRRAQSEHARTESRLARLRAVAPVAIMECDAEGRIQASNVMWSRLTGQAERDWEGRYWWEALPPSERARARTYWSATLESGKEATAEFRMGAEEDPAARWVLARLAPETAGTPEGGRWVITLTDVTARRNAEEQLRHAQRMEAVGRLAGGVAHDFNNLLTSIGGFATLARNSLPARSGAHDDLVEIQNATERGRALTRQLLTFSRHDRIRPEPIGVGEVALGLEKMLRRLVREDLRLNIEVRGDSAAVLADRGQLEQVITNLVVNASDATPDGGRVRVDVSPALIEESISGAKGDIPPGRYVLLSVSDNGSGVPLALQARIFEPFFTTKAPGKGTGLGLSTVWGIVRQTGGHVHLYSEPGQGTVFKIYLPAINQEPAHPGEAGGAEGFGEAALPTGKTVLIVEDQEAVRRLAVRILQIREFTVLEAADGTAALEVLDRHPGTIDLVITDVVMRGMGGLELVEEVRSRGHDAPALFMSGYAGADLPLGDAAFLEKPFSPADLVRKVREVLDQASEAA